MIEIAWINEGNFRLDMVSEPDYLESRVFITQQLYAFVMGWA